MVIKNLLFQNFKDIIFYKKTKNSSEKTFGNVNNKFAL